MKILVTGSTGFIGSRLAVKLIELGHNVYESTNADWTREIMAYEVNLESYDIIFHLAAKVGGISHNINHPATMLSDNIKIALTMISAWARAKTPKLVIPGSICAYPDLLNKPILESDYITGVPHWSNLPYAYAKRTIAIALNAYREQYGLQFSHPILANVYGPHHNQKEIKQLHVIPALISKFKDTSKPVEVLGSGKAVRDYLYIDDAVDALIHSALVLPPNMSVNYGTGDGISVCELVEIINWNFNRQDIVYRSDMPDGQLYRVPDVSLAKEHGWSASIGLEQGIRRMLL